MAFDPIKFADTYKQSTINSRKFDPTAFADTYKQLIANKQTFDPVSFADKYKQESTVDQNQSGAFPNTRKNLQEIASDPFNLKADPTKAIGDAWEAVKSIPINEWDNLKNLFTNSPTASAFIGNTLKTAVGAVPFIPAAAPVVFGFAAFFAAAKNIPVLGTVSKLIDTTFNALPEGASYAAGKAVEKLPISQESKDNIKEGVEQTASLTAQILEFALAHKVIKPYLPSEKTAAPFREEFIKNNPTYSEDIKNVPAKEINKLVKEKPEDAAAIVKKSIDWSREKRGLSPLEESTSYQEMEQKYTPTDTTIPTETTGGDPSKITVTTRGNAFKDGYISFKEAKKSLIDAGYSETEAGDILASVADKTKKVVGKVSVNSKDIKDAAFEYSTPKTTPEITVPQGEPQLSSSEIMKGEIIPKPEGNKISKSANDLNKMLVEQGEAPIPKERLAKFSSSEGQRASETKLVKDFVSEMVKTDTGIEKLKEIIKGNDPLPEGVKGQILYNEVRDWAFKNNTEFFRREVANSPLNTERSIYASELESAKYGGDKKSLAKQTEETIKQLKDEKKVKAEKVAKKEGTTVEKKLTKMKEINDNIINKIKEERKPLRRSRLSKFIESLPDCQ